MKKVEVLLKDYVRKLNDTELGNLHTWYENNLPGDKANIADMYSLDKEMDRWLASASSADEWFDMVDLAGEYVEKEHQWRNSDRFKRIPKRS